MRRVLFVLLVFVSYQRFWQQPVSSQWIKRKSNHLKAYGITYWVLSQGTEVDWLA